MNLFKNISIFIVFLSLPNIGFSQVSSKDSLLQIIHTAKQDSSKVNTILNVLEYYYLDNVDTTIFLCNAALEISTQINYQHGISESLGWLGYLYKGKGDISKAIQYNISSLKVIRSSNKSNEIKKNEALILNNLAYLYNHIGKIEESLKLHDESLKIREEINDLEGVATSYNNLGAIYQDQKELKLSNTYYHKSLAIFKQLNHQRGIAIGYTNIASNFLDLNQNDSALKYVKKSFVINQKINDKDALGNDYTKFATIFKSWNQIDSALFFSEKSLEIRTKIEDKEGLTYSLNAISKIYIEKKQYQKALSYVTQSYKIANEIEYPIAIMNASAILSKVYRKMNNFKAALKYRNIQITMRDSVNNSQTLKAAVQQEMQYQYKTEKAISDKEHEKRIALANEEQKRQLVIIFSIIGILILIIIFSIIIYKKLKTTRQQKSVIEDQNYELNQYNEEIIAQRDQIEYQKEKVEKHQNEIISSISYAKRIQNALLTSDESILKLPYHFIYFKPRDIVSGDFYWIKQKKEFQYFAAVDCTGHGVPGAFMSMLGVAFLNEILSVEKTLKPSEILDLLREKIIKELSQTEDVKGTRDGMDISLIRIDTLTKKINWAGANNPLYIINNNQLSIIKGDKQPISYTKFSIPFTNHELESENGNFYYLFSDGYCDQFGGEKDRKFGRQQFKDTLLKGASNFSKSYEILNDEFINWKGSQEQIDDVLVIGIKA